AGRGAAWADLPADRRARRARGCQGRGTGPDRGPGGPGEKRRDPRTADGSGHGGRGADIERDEGGTPMSGTYITVERKGRVAVWRFENPPHNFLNRNVIAELDELVGALETDESVG